MTRTRIINTASCGLNRGIAAVTTATPANVAGAASFLRRAGSLESRGFLSSFVRHRRCRGVTAAVVLVLLCRPVLNAVPGRVLLLRALSAAGLVSDGALHGAGGTG